MTVARTRYCGRAGGYQAERLDVSFFVLGDDDGDKQAADYAPTQVGQRLGSGSMETKCEASLI
jgi:hypothetical protein